MFACPNCKSREVHALVHEYQCINCGRLLNGDGTLVPLIDQYGADHPEVTDGE